MIRNLRISKLRELTKYYRICYSVYPQNIRDNEDVSSTILHSSNVAAVEKRRKAAEILIKIYTSIKRTFFSNSYKLKVDVTLLQFMTS